MSQGPYRPASVRARVATQEDLPAVAETMARAFFDDPVWAWAFPDPGRRLEQHRSLWRLMIDSALEDGGVWLTDGAAACSSWIAPGRPELRPEYEELVEPLLLDLLGPAGAARVLETFERFDAAHPHDEQHYYLSLLATDPEHSGRGEGMGLLAENLARIDGEGMPAFLESSNPANDHRYERLGFVKCGKFELAGEGPEVTQMWRDPR